MAETAAKLAPSLGVPDSLSIRRSLEGLRYFPEIDGLRALAVGAVLAFHAFPGALPGGFVGVDVFFVISGFLITGIMLDAIAKDKFSIADFYIRRIRRIFPALIVVLLACLIAGWWLLSYQEYRQLGKHIAAAAGFFVNFQLFKEAGYFDTDAALKPLLHLWSLGVEEQFYILWPVLLLFASRLGRIRAAIVVVFSVSFAANIVLVHWNEAAAFYFPISRFWELMLGAWLAATRTRADDFPRGIANPAAFAGLALILISLFLIDDNKPFPGFWALLPAIGTALLIWCGSNAWVNRTVLGSKPFVFVGLISYPLYLWHWPLLSFAHIEARGEDVGTATVLALLSLAFLLAAATYLLIEKPIHNTAFPEFRKRWAPAVMLSIALAALAGIQIPRSEWALSRFPPKVRALLTFNTGQNRLGKGKGCFLRARKGPSHFVAKCVDPPDGAKPLLLLWGDSHAAHLVPGFRKLQGEMKNFRLARYTAAGCPAVFAKMPKGKECAEVNRFVIDRISALKPEIVVIAGFWYSYGLLKSKKFFWKLDAAALADTVRKAKDAGAKKVIFVGELPAWKIFQPIISAELLTTTGELPARTTSHLDPKSLTVDRLLRSAIMEAGAVYISPSEFLCDSSGCEIQTNGIPVFVDKDHLSAAGSLLLVRPILRAANLFEAADRSTAGRSSATTREQ